jgi:quercetin dioxygenase-like cupin family protein
MLGVRRVVMTVKTGVVFVLGVVTGVGAMMLAGSGVYPALAAQAAGQAESRVVLENDLVRVKDVTFPAGVADTGMHTHDLAHVGIILTEGALRFTNPDGTVETVKFTPGTVGFREANATHMVASAGPGPMRVIEVELKRP